jgi:hypothetical protein
MAWKSLTGFDANSQKIVNVADPTSNTDAANKQYVDGVARGLDWHAHVRAIPTANVSISSPGTTVDGVTMASGDRVLLINQSTGSQNGLWVWNGAAVALSRPTDYASAAVLTKGSVTVTVTEGSTYADKVYTLSTDGTVTVDTTATTWVVVGGGTSYSAGNGLQLSTGTFSVLANGSSIDVSASGVKIADAAAGNGLGVSAGVLSVNTGSGLEINTDALRIATSAAGTGLTGGGGSALAVDTAVVVRKYSTDVPSGSTTATITHSLGTQDITWSLREKSGNAFVITDGVATDANTLTLTFASAPTTGQYRVVVHG